MTRHCLGPQYIEIELHPRAERQTLTPTGRPTLRNVEAYCRLAIGPASHPLNVFDPQFLAELGWALLTAGHRLARLQGVASPVVPDNQLTIYDTLGTVKR